MQPLTPMARLWHMSLLLLLLSAAAWADYFPFKGDRPLNAPAGVATTTSGSVTRHSRQWQAPLLQPWEVLRATDTSITVAWTPAWNPWADVSYYELQSRRPTGYPLVLSDYQALQLREADREADLDFERHAAWSDEAWTPWELAYQGRGRVFAKHVDRGSPHAVQFRVRACGKHYTDGCSDWSPVQTAHTILSAMQDRVNFHVRGAGKNAHNYTIIEVNRQTIYKRRDETGLVLAIFSRLDFSLQWLRTYDTHANRTESLQMSKDIRQFNQSFFVVVASTIAWEWHAAHSLAKTLEFCGAYHFGQWAHVFAEQPHYASTESDLQQVASQDEFGHPYAFIGIPGIGAGNGWESLMHNTGQYLPRSVRPQDAVIRGIAYYDYVFRIFRLQDVLVSKARFYLKGEPPQPETFHSPVPSEKRIVDKIMYPIAEMRPSYIPYIGTLSSNIFSIIEANKTVPPFNYAFALVTTAKVVYVDPRPRTSWITEIERIWEGASARYWSDNGTLFHPGLLLSQRSCFDFLTYGFYEASPTTCGENFVLCCDKIDVPGMPAAGCGVGIAPTLCSNSTKIKLTNTSDLLKTKWPFDFRVIDWTS